MYLRFHCFHQTCSHWGHGHIAFLNTVTQKANALLEDIFISHCCLLHHLNGAVSRVALKVLWLYGVSCSCFSAIFLVTWDFVMRRCCAEWNVQSRSNVHIASTNKNYKFSVQMRTCISMSSYVYMCEHNIQ